MQEAETVHETLTEMLSEPSGMVRISMPVDLMSEPFDVALRMGEPKDVNLIARLLATYPFHLYASADYLAQHGTPQSLDDLAHHQCLAFRQEQWQLFRNGQEKIYNFDAVMIGQNLGLLERLVTQNMGVALLPDIVVKNGDLCRVLSEWSGKSSCLYAITTTRLLPKKVQVLIDFLREHLRYDGD